MSSQVIGPAPGARARRLTRSVAAARGDWPAWALLAVSFALYAVARHYAHPSSIDLRIYRIEGQAVRDHLDPFGQLRTPNDLQATYPPFAVLVFVVLGVVPVGLLEVLAVLGNLALLGVVAVLACRLVGVPVAQRRVTAVVMTALGVWAEPVWLTLGNGQINLVLLVLVLWDLTRPADSRWRGVGIGIAAGLKVTPALFIVYLLVTGRVRAAGTGALTFAATIGVSALLLPRSTHHYWTSLVFDVSRVGHVEDVGNQSLTGDLARLTHGRLDTIGTPGTALLAAAGIAVAALAYRRCGEAWGACACAVTGLLIAPIAWTHHWVWVVPIAVLLWHHCRRALIPLAVVFWSHAVWLVPHDPVGVELHLTAPQVLLSVLYTAGGAGFLVLAAVVATVRRPTRPASGTST